MAKAKMADVTYKGPSSAINVGDYGSHAKDAIKPYPGAFAKALVEEEKEHQFEIIGENER